MNPDLENLTEAEVLHGLQRNRFSAAQRAELGLTDEQVRDLLAGRTKSPFREATPEPQPTIVSEGLGRVLVGDDEADDRPYEEWKNDELRTAIVERNEAREQAGMEPLPFGGRKEEMAASLYRDDEERPDDEAGDLDDDGDSSGQE